MATINKDAVRKNLTKYFKSVENTPEDIRQAIAEIALDVLFPKQGSVSLSNEEVFSGFAFTDNRKTTFIDNWPETDAVMLRRLKDRVNIYVSPSIVKQFDKKVRPYFEIGFNEDTAEILFRQAFDNKGFVIQAGNKNAYIRLSKAISSKLEKYDVNWNEFILTECRDKPCKHFIFSVKK